jgi:hypothetical protein
MSKVIKKGDIKQPVLAKKTVEVPELGGAVVVTGLLLKDRVTMLAKGSLTVASMLARTVVDADGELIFDEKEWNTFGSTPEGFKASVALFKEARKLSGFDLEEAEKNS